jgi:uncharacterized protein (DUF305 family)
MRRFPAVAALTLGLTLALTGCGSDDNRSSSSTATALSTTEHNEADVDFATQMIQHHAQALSMVDLTVGRDLDPKVAALAEEIRQAQAPEIETMSDWLQEWDEEIPETVRDHANAHGDGHSGADTGTDMPGMMSADDMAALEDATDAEFDEMWMEMMIEHHEGAVEMARTEEADGQFKPAVNLAKEIQASQAAEIDTMKDLLG